MSSDGVVRVLHMIASLDIGGSQSMVMNIYRNIDRSKVQFDFIVDHPEQMYFAEEIKKLGGKIFVLHTFRLINIGEVRKAWASFFRKHPEYKILHSHSRSYASLYLPIAKKYGVKTIIHSHSTSNGKGAKAIIKNIMQYPLRFQADYYMACSEEAGEWLFGKRVLKKNNFYIIKNAIDAKRFIYCLNKRRAVRCEFGLDDNTFVLGALGRVILPKNPAFIIEVFRKLKEWKVDSKLLFVGDGDLLDDMKHKTMDYGLSGDVIFTGARDDADRMLCAMDCYIFPSLWEGLGISLIEAQASGLRCLCSENIPREAIFTDLVKVLPLGKGSEVWAGYIADTAGQKCAGNTDCIEDGLDMDEALGMRYRRENQYATVVKAGYDIGENIAFMQKFYLSLNEQK